jgi:lipopolysaccharide transport system permease protein
MYQLRYRQSAIGLAWAFLLPLVTLGVGTLVFHEVAGVETGDTPYTVFAMAALVPWTFCANSLSFGVMSVTSSQQLVSRLPFPRAALPISVVGLSLIDFVVSAVVFVAIATIVGQGIPWTAIWFPVPLVIEILLVAGVVLLLSSLNVFARDIRLAAPLVVQLWLFLTPVMYPLDAVPEGLRAVYLANPMTGIVETFRDILVAGSAPRAEMLVPATIGALGAFLVGTWYFSATESRFADVI